MSTKSKNRRALPFLSQPLPFFNIFLVILFLCNHLKSSIAQNQSGGPVSYLTGNTYIGGYHIKCNGDNTGVLEANPTFGISKQYFQIKL